MSLTTLPAEPLQLIAFFLTAHTPLGPPSALLPLLRTCKTIYAALTSTPTLLAKIFALKFDTGAAYRRLGTPPTSHALAAQLKHACTVLRVLRTGDPTHPHAPEALFAALLMMLDNDGKNLAQLRYHAHVHRFLHAHLHTPHGLWRAASTNDGWPYDSTENSAVLWLLWMTTERRRLLGESAEEREAVVLRVLPYAILPQRYAAAEAPPNHFKLPLPADFPIAVSLTNPPPSSPSQTPQHHPLGYPHYLPPRAVHSQYFTSPSSESSTGSTSTTTFTPPLSSIPAKLLFIARRELRPVVIPPHIPAGPPHGPAPSGPGHPPTRADYHELNRAKGALLPRGACWDWAVGRAWGVNPELVFRAEEDDYFVASAGGRERPMVEEEERRVIEEGDEESRKWDTMFWRMRLCGEYRDRPSSSSRKEKEERELQRAMHARTYSLGCMKGSWKGKIYIPNATLYNHALQNPLHPSLYPPSHPYSQLLRTHYTLKLQNQLELEWVMSGAGSVSSSTSGSTSSSTSTSTSTSAAGTGTTTTTTTKTALTPPQIQTRLANITHAQYSVFSEDTVALMMQPLGMDVLEHHRVCGCSPGSRSGSGCGSRSRGSGLAEEQEDEEQEQEGCGIVPIPELEKRVVVSRIGAGAAGAGAGLDEVPVPASQSSQQPQNTQQNTQPPFPTTSALPEDYKSHPAPILTPTVVDVDVSMQNAWFGGAVGGVRWGVRRGGGGGTGGSGGDNGDANEVNDIADGHDGDNEHGDEEENTGRKRREQTVFSVNYAIPDRMIKDEDALCPSLFPLRFGSGLGPDSVSGSGLREIGDEETDPKPTQTQQQKPKPKPKTYVYETYDKDLPSSHDILAGREDWRDEVRTAALRSLAAESQTNTQPGHSRSRLSKPEPPRPTCATCLMNERRRLERKKREDEEGRRVLDGFMRSLGRRRGVGDGEGLMDLDDREDDQMEMDEMDDLDMDAFGAEDVVRIVERSVSRSHDDDDDDVVLDDEDEENENENVCATSPSDDTEDSDTSELSTRSRKRKWTNAIAQMDDGRVKRPRRPSSPSHPHPPQHDCPHTPTSTSTPNPPPCTGTRDILLTGATSNRYSIYQPFTCYGRVRLWDGLVGLLRVTTQPDRGISYLFIFGYVIAERNFVGEWRMSSADVLKCGWGSAFVLSRAA